MSIVKVRTKYKLFDFSEYLVRSHAFLFFPRVFRKSKAKKNNIWTKEKVKLLLNSIQSFFCFGGTAIIYSLAEPWSLESKKRQAEERKIETEIQSKSVTEVMAIFLLLSNKPINSSITITCPSFVFSSLTDFTSNHWGRSWRKKKKKTLEKFQYETKKLDFWRVKKRSNL